jgi:hypothetical protein
LQRSHPQLFSHDQRGLSHHQTDDPWDSWPMSKALQAASIWRGVNLSKGETSSLLSQIERESRELLFTRLPYLGASGRIERDLYCRVCAQASYEDRLSRVPELVNVRMDGTSSHTCMALQQAAGLRWSRNGFFEHIRECPCIKILMDNRICQAPPCDAR